MGTDKDYMMPICSEAANKLIQHKLAIRAGESNVIFLTETGEAILMRYISGTQIIDDIRGE